MKEKSYKSLLGSFEETWTIIIMSIFPHFAINLYMCMCVHMQACMCECVIGHQEEEHPLPKESAASPGERASAFSVVQDGCII